MAFWLAKMVIKWELNKNMVIQRDETCWFSLRSWWFHVIRPFQRPNTADKQSGSNMLISWYLPSGKLTQTLKINHFEWKQIVQALSGRVELLIYGSVIQA
jgi:hypothetical protein